MAKRTSGKYERKARDFYPTPFKALRPLLAHLEPNTVFVEPCAGDGALVDMLEDAGHHCIRAFDIEPQRATIAQGDALTDVDHCAQFYITNPPWERTLLHPLILNLIQSHACWLLFDADWAHTEAAAGFGPKATKEGDLLQYCAKIVSVGRVKWIEGTKSQSFDNCAWYLFKRETGNGPQFIGRKATK